MEGNSSIGNQYCATKFIKIIHCKPVVTSNYDNLLAQFNYIDICAFLFFHSKLVIVLIPKSIFTFIIDIFSAHLY